MCSQITNIVVPHIELTIRPCLELHKRGRGLEDMSSHGGFENDGLKKVKLQFPEHDVLEVEEIHDDLESCILKARCDKVMPSQMMKNWKECGEDSLWGFARQGHIIHKLVMKKKPWVSG